MKNKTDELTKEKRIYTIELLVFMVIFFVLGLLILIDVLPVKGTFRKVLIWVSLFGSVWLFVDFFWTIFSKKRRAKHSLLDKSLALIAAASVFVMDIITFVQGFDNTVEMHETFVGILFCYLALVYLIEAIYHWFKPIPLLVEAAKEEEELKNKTEAETPEEKEKEEEDFASKLKKAEQERVESLETKQ